MTLKPSIVIDATDNKVSDLVSFLMQEQLEQKNKNAIEESRNYIHEELLGLHLEGMSYEDILMMLEWEKLVWQSRLVCQDLIEGGWIKPEQV